MNAALLVAYEYPDLPQLRLGLSSALDLLHTRSVPRAQTMLSDPRITILILDCMGDGAAEYELLRWVELNRPEIECIVLTGTEHFCAVRETRRRNLYRILKPTNWQEVEAITLRTATKVERMQSGDWARDPTLLRRQDRQFWSHLLNGMIPPDEQALLQAAPPTTFPYQDHGLVLPVLICLRRWHQLLTPRSQDDHRYAVKHLAERTLLGDLSGCSLPWPTDRLFLFLYGPQLPDQDTLRHRCEHIVQQSGAYLDCDVFCYYGTPCLAHETAAQADLLLRGDMDNVTGTSPVLSLKQITRKREPLSLPVLRDWMPYFINGREEEFCRCIEDYFHQVIAANNMDRAFLARFQQDFIQEISFALKNAGIPLHDLFSDTDELLWMEAAIRYVPDMLQWVRRIAGKAIRLMNTDDQSLSVSQRVCDYLNKRLVYPLRRDELSRALHLSEGHIARTFRQEMGMSISQYQTRQRINLACLTMEQTDLSLTQIAEQVGYHDYPYFFKIFKRLVGMSPTEYQAQMHDSSM